MRPARVAFLGVRPPRHRIWASPASSASVPKLIAFESLEFWTMPCEDRFGRGNLSHNLRSSPTAIESLGFLRVAECLGAGQKPTGAYRAASRVRDLKCPSNGVRSWTLAARHEPTRMLLTRNAFWLHFLRFSDSGIGPTWSVLLKEHVRKSEWLQSFEATRRFSVGIVRDSVPRIRFRKRRVRCGRAGA